jgi:hypothetical protein
MNTIKKYVKWTAAFGFLMIAGSVLHVQQWVASAAAIFSQPVSNVIEANRRPYQKIFLVTGCFSTEGSCGGPVANDVPAGYQLVIDHVSVHLRADSGVTSMSAALSSLTNNDNMFFALAYGGDGGASLKNFVGTQSVKMVVPSGQSLWFDVFGQSGGTNFPDGSFTVGVTGYLESCASYPGGNCPLVID